ncbi:hypothetical protein Tco_0814607 [Tanacetum coccineum]
MAKQIIPAAQLVPKFQSIRRCISKVPDTKDTIKFKLDTQEITYTVDMFCDTLKLPVETPDNPFIVPVNIKVIESFMQMVGYQGVIDKVSAFYMKFLAQPWQTMFKDVIQYPRFTKLIIDDLMKKFPVIPQRLDEDYHSIKDDIPLQVVEGEKDEESYASKFDASILDDDADNSGNRLDPRSHKENPEVIHDDDVNDDEKKDEKEDDVRTHEMGSLENRTEKMQTPIPTPPRYPRRNLSSDKNIQVQSSSRSASQNVQASRIYDQGHGTKIATNDLIEGNLKRVVADTVIQERDAIQSEVPALISKEFDAHAPKIIEELFMHYVQTNVIQDAWVEETIIDKDEVIPKDETPELITEFQNVDKRIPTIFDRARIKATLNDMLSDQFRNVEENPNEPLRCLYNKDLFFLKNGNTEEKKYILSLHKIHVESFPEADLDEKLNHWVRKEFKNFNEDARLSIQHWKDSWHKRVYKQNQRKVKDNPEDYFSNHKIIEFVRITTDQLYGLDFMEQIIMMRENDKPDSFSEADFKYLNKNDIKDLYYLCRNKKIKVNLTAPTLIFTGIEAHDPYSIVDKADTGLIYLNRINEKRVMYLVESVKLCDATFEKVLKEVKLMIFQNKFWKKSPLLGELDLDILKAYEREITKCLRHREQMRR